MRKKIKRLTSGLLAVILSLATFISPIAPTIVANAAPDSWTELQSTDVTTETDGTTLTVTAINNPVEGSAYYFTSALATGGETEVVLGENLLANTNGSSIKLGQDVGFEKPAAAVDAIYLEFEGNNKIVTTSSAFTDTFADSTSLVEVVGFGNVIKADTSGFTVNLFGTFRNCTALKTVEIDLTSHSGKIKFSQTFEGCTALETFKAIDCTIEDVEYINSNIEYTDGDAVPVSPEYTFNNCRFPDTDTADDVFHYAFNKFDGTINLTNCKTITDGKTFTVSGLVGNNGGYPSGNLTLNFDGSAIGALDDVIVSNANYSTVTLNNVVTSDTTSVCNIFANDVSVSTSVTGINTWDMSNVESIIAPFSGLNMGDATKESAVVDQFFALDLTNATLYNSIGNTESKNYTDLSGVNLNTDTSAEYYISNEESSIYVPEQFTSPAQFGGTYYAMMRLAEFIEDTSGGGNDTLISVTPTTSDAVIEPSTGASSRYFYGFSYDNSLIKVNTVYKNDGAHIQITDVYTGDVRETSYAGDFEVAGLNIFDSFEEGTVFYTDEALANEWDPEAGDNLTIGETFYLYWTSEEIPTSSVSLTGGGATSYAFSTDIDTLQVKDTRTNTVNFKRDGYTSEINVTEVAAPTTFTKGDGWDDYANYKWYQVQLTMVEDATSTEAVVKELVNATLDLTADLPDDFTATGAYQMYHFNDGLTVTPETVPCEVEGSTFTYTMDSFSYVALGYNGASTVTPEPGQDYAVVCNLPNGWSAEFVGDVTEITATLADGTTRKLGQSGDVITISAKSITTPEAYNQPTDFASFTKRAFSTVSIQIANGSNTYNVKSIDGQLRLGIYTWLSSLDHYQWRVYSYPNGVMQAPVQVPAILSPADTEGETCIATINTCGTYVVLHHGAWAAVNTKTYTIELKWDDVGYESMRPAAVQGTWTSTDNSGTFTAPKVTDSYVQTIYVEVPKAETNVEFAITDFPGYSVAASSTATYVRGFTLTYDGSNAFTDKAFNITWANDNSGTRPNQIEATLTYATYEGAFDTITKTFTRTSTTNADTFTFENVPTTITGQAVTNYIISISPIDGYTITSDQSGLNFTATYTGDVTYTSYDFTLYWNDQGSEEFRPNSVEVLVTAIYEDESEVETYQYIRKNTSLYEQKITFDVADTNEGSPLVDVTTVVTPIDTHVITPGTGAEKHSATLRYTGTGNDQVTTQFGVNFKGGTSANYPESVTLMTTARYDDGTEIEKENAIPIGSDGSGYISVSYPMVNDAGASYTTTSFNWPEIPNFTQTGVGRVAEYTYTGQGGTTIQTTYPVTIKFVGDTVDTSKRPTSVTVNWTATTTSGKVTNGSAGIPITVGANDFTQNIEVPDTYGEARTVTFAGPTVQGYVLGVNGSTLTYTYSTASSTNSVNYEIIFKDESNKAGLRPAKLTVTLADTTNASNTVSSELTIPNNTTTTTESYKGTVSIPAGTTYSITKVEGVPTNYTVTMSGLSATLSHTPETVSKTFTVKWSGDVEEVRPSSLTITVKTGETEMASLTVSKDTNWTATTSLPKYVKGVEAAYSITAPSVTNYKAEVSGDTVTYTYTGTLTEEQKNAIAGLSDSKEEDKEDTMYSYEDFDWIDYANRYPDVKKAFGYNKEALYAHYIRYGIAEGRYATFDGKYANVNEEILAAYFPDDYKYRVSSTGSVGEMLEEMGESTNSTTSSTTSDSSSVTVDEDGNTVIKTQNADGTTTETIIDKDGNVVKTSTYATGDDRMSATMWIYVGIILVAVCLGAVSFTEYRKCDKTRKFIDNSIQS